MIIDSHCHLNYEPMSLSLKETLQRANNDGVKYLLTISTEDKSFDKILQIISNNKCVYGTYGIHPQGSGDGTARLRLCPQSAECLSVDPRLGNVGAAL